MSGKCRSTDGAESAPWTVEDFAVATGVSRETLARFETYASLLRRWQKAINLVGPRTLPDLWRRHFYDSAQIFPLLARRDGVLVDLGSGAGFPGLVLAILGEFEVHLVESDTRKAVFLREVARAVAMPGRGSITVHNRRIEAMAPFAADLVTARALAPLDQLIGYAVPFLAEGAEAWFLKGQGAREELEQAAKHWTMTSVCHKSSTDTHGVILQLRGIRRANRG